MSAVDVRTALTDQVASREEMGHDGRSGARLERLVLVDGTRLVVKRTIPAADLAMLVTGDIEGRELGLWQSGVFANLPDPVGHAIVEGWREPDGTIITVMRDLGAAVVTWHQPLGKTECGRILGAMAALHRRFDGAPPAGLCPLETYLRALAPATAAHLSGGANGLPTVIVRGWERAADLVPAAEFAALEQIHLDPEPLARGLRAQGTTLVHGDLWPVNVALEPTLVTLLDWGLAVEGPPALDLATFLIATGRLATPGREQLIRAFRDSGGTAEAKVLDRSLLAVFAMYAWNKALDAVEHRDPAVRHRERVDLEWWVQRIRTALDDAG